MKHRSGVEPSDPAATVTDTLRRLERLLDQEPTPDRVCIELARLLHVQQTEVALLRLERGSLKFLFPAGLRTAGSIPLTSSAVAARTAATKTTMLSNGFTKVRHISLFEGVKLGSPETSEEHPAPIQKMMSVPVLHEEGGVLGVIQISRKGLDSSLAGPDFTHEDLRQLERAAKIVSKMAFMRETSAVSSGSGP